MHDLTACRLAAQLDWKHGELFQLLEYKPGQYYAQHHDFIEQQRQEPAGVRILTVFLYVRTMCTPSDWCACTAVCLVGIPVAHVALSCVCCCACACACACAS